MEPLAMLCQVCLKEQFKYKCPRCGIKTCSVGCIKQHKVRQNCDGIKQKESQHLQQMPMANISLRTLRDDMTFLGKGIDQINCLRKLKLSLTNNQRGEETKKFRKVRLFMKKQRQITYKASPSPLIRKSRLNQTTLSTSTGKDPTLLWSVEFIIHKGNDLKNSDKLLGPLYLHQINENTRVSRF